jgi:hypothetical protein
VVLLPLLLMMMVGHHQRLPQGLAINTHQPLR